MLTVKKLSMVIAGAALSVSCVGLEPTQAHGLITGPHAHPQLESSEGIQDYLVVPPGAVGRPAYYEASSGPDVPFNLYTFLATSEETGGEFNLFTFLIQPGGGVPLHTHLIDAEVLYILDGEFTISLGAQTTVVAPGTFVYLPTGRPHGFQNLTTKPATALSFTNPGGLDKFFEEVGVLATGNELPGPEDFDFSNGPAALARAGLVEGDIIVPNSLDYSVVLPGAVGRPTFEGLFGGEYTSLATLEETGGAFSYSIFSLLSQSGLPALTQSTNAESYYILEGDLTFQLGNQTTAATPGTHVYIPADQPYAFTNIGSTPVRALSISVRSVPEPSSEWGLLGFGACVGAGWVLRKKNLLLYK